MFIGQNFYSRLPKDQPKGPWGGTKHLQEATKEACDQQRFEGNAASFPLHLSRKIFLAALGIHRDHYLNLDFRKKIWRCPRDVQLLHKFDQVFLSDFDFTKGPN